MRLAKMKESKNLFQKRKKNSENHLTNFIAMS